MLLGFTLGDHTWGRTAYWQERGLEDIDNVLITCQAQAAWTWVSQLNILRCSVLTPAK